MNGKLIEQAEMLRNSIKQHENDIDNPVLTTSILNELEFFIENVKED